VINHGPLASISQKGLFLMSNKKKKAKAEAQQIELERRKHLIANALSDLGTDDLRYDTTSIASDYENPLWGKFTLSEHILQIHVAAYFYDPITDADKIRGKAWMTVRANADDSCALSKHIYADNVDEIIKTFHAYKELAENIPPSTDWTWYKDHGFKYYQV
jgi:hypothetical protein